MVIRMELKIIETPNKEKRVLITDAVMLLYDGMAIVNGAIIIGYKNIQKVADDVILLDTDESLYKRWIIQGKIIQMEEVRYYES